VSGSGYALIAEFDRRRAELYRQTAADQGLETVVVRDGNAAKAMLENNGAPTLLITDLSLPGSDGFDLISDLRRRFTPKKTAVVVFSAFTELRATAADLLVSLDVTEIRDKSSSATVVREAVARALASLSHADAVAQADPKTPEQLSHDFLQGVTRIFHVPIALLSVNVRQYHWFTAYTGVTEPLTATQEKQHWWVVLQQVIDNQQPLVIPDMAALFGSPLLVLPIRIRGFVAVPFMATNDHPMGVLALIDLKPLALGAEQIDRLIELARPMADEFRRRYAIDSGTEIVQGAPRTEESWAALEQLALTDAMTGLYNRHAGEQAIAREAARGRRAGSSLSLALLDLDNFKQVNDVHGHEAGDRVLSEVGRILRSSLRASDLAIRWGGDEFLILLPDVGVIGAAAFAERTRMQVEALSFGGVGRVTLSAGVVEVGRREDSLAALRRADTNLYDAKVGGRNRVTSGTNDGDSKLKSG
jgi:diguanylate cyclase (GGDEF)-like protein